MTVKMIWAISEKMLCSMFSNKRHSLHRLRSNLLAKMCLLGVCFLIGWFLGISLRPGLSPAQRSLMVAQARQFALDPLLVEAIILTESSGRAGVVSSHGAIGLMQLMPQTALELAKELSIAPQELNLLEPQMNMQLGCYYLHLLMRRFCGDLVLVLAAYNTGPTRVSRWVQASPTATSWEIVDKSSRETRRFVRRVLSRYRSA